MQYLLAVDIGNTNIGFGVFADGSLVHSWHTSAQTRCTSDEYRMMINSFFVMAQIDINAVSDSIICSVSPSATEYIRQAVASFCDTTPMVLNSSHKTDPIKIDYSPTEIGMDRVADAAAGYKYYGGQPLIIVDAGTGLVFDAISSDGVYLGGAIAPGIELAADALNSKATLLPQIAFQKPAAAIGKNTKHSIQSGFLFGYAALISGMIDKFANEMSAKGDASICTIATGGMASLIASLSDRFDHVDKDLTLKGLFLLHKLNISS